MKKLYSSKWFINISRLVVLAIYRWRFKKLIIRKYGSDVKVFFCTFIQREHKIKAQNVKTIIDAGAYTGLSTLWFAREYPNALIIAIEPAKDNFKLLQLHTNHIKNVVAINAALWSSAKTISIHNPGNSEWSYSVVTTEAEELGKTTTTTLNALIEKYQLDSIDVLKLDIEGAEKEIFESNTEWASQVQNVIIELHEELAPGCTESLNKLFPSTFWKKEKKGEKVILSKKSISQQLE